MARRFRAAGHSHMCRASAWRARQDRAGRGPSSCRHGILPIGATATAGRPRGRLREWRIVRGCRLRGMSPAEAARPAVRKRIACHWMSQRLIGPVVARPPEALDGRVQGRGADHRSTARPQAQRHARAAYVRCERARASMVRAVRWERARKGLDPGQTPLRPGRLYPCAGR